MGVLAPAVMPAEHGGDITLALRADLPRYDPAIRAAHLAAQAAAAEDPRPRTTSSAPAVVASSTSGSDTLVLDPITVWATPTAKPPPPLPRLSFFAPARNLPAEPFESPGARDARLIKKHLSPLDQALNRFRLPFIGQSLGARAREAEAVIQRAQELNAMAEAIDLGALIGQDPAMIRKLRAEYLRLYYSGPK